MNKQSFPDGSFVCHGITHVVNNRRVSAWYDKLGVLLDCEMIDSHGTASNIPHTWTHVYKRLASIGGAYSV